MVLCLFLFFLQTKMILFISIKEMLIILRIQKCRKG